MSRRLFGAAALAATGAFSVRRMVSDGSVQDRRKATSRVAILCHDSYSDRLDSAILEGLRLFDLGVLGKTVLLKPNLVEFIPDADVNTNPRLVGAAAEAFLALGARTVLIGEGPGHERDTQLVIADTGLESELRDRGIQFVDLNRDEVIRVRLATRFSGVEHLWLPRTVLEADFIVSMPKIKTHHWAGVTLSMKNMFGVVPGNVYGWPKNPLHCPGIDRSILDINAAVRPHFVIADGIVAMEGNGPLQGSSRKLGRIVLSDDPVAADFTCAHLMGLNPGRVSHLAQAAEFLGNGAFDRIEQVGENLPAVVQPFAVLPDFAYLRG
jgi:uncharacterized protein (DUF362 family)